MGNWDSKKDVFLLRFSTSVGANFVASHDFGMSAGAGNKRIAWLKGKGLIPIIVESQIAECNVKLAYLRKNQKFERDSLNGEIEAWESINDFHADFGS